ncbi:MAG: 4-hydroxy-3-methylbut-2-enyl diphosphate reductase [Ignavibacteriaceae bacterium]|nr:4-hydroxy-3-methylbut-2-enyl diphosphate reductase [Ignavibacteriaceae bacterium]
MKKFEIPSFYRSSIISRIKQYRKLTDTKKNDLKPFVLDFGTVMFFIPRHFGFCYGVENAIEIAYKTIESNSNKNIYLLSEMIHNPGVNNDLKDRGIRFILDTLGNNLIDWTEIKKDDIVIIPAFGTTLEIEAKLKEIGISAYQYNTTCPFVEKVWNRSSQLADAGYTIVIHGKHLHEETRATFSHSKIHGPSLIVRDLRETKFLSKVISEEKSKSEFYSFFSGKYSENFNADKDLEKIGVVNQTTMLATETQEIADLLKSTMINKYGKELLKFHFADTRDTLCYATYDNQEATYELLKNSADFAVVVGGYNSSNTSHIVELCEAKLPTYFVSSAEKVISRKLIKHYNILSKAEILTEDYIPNKDKVKILITSGASCPDSVVDEILTKLHSFFPNIQSIQELLNEKLKL